MMTKTESKSEQDLSSGNAKKTTNSDSSKLFEQYEIEDTPFTATKVGEDWFLNMGKYRLTQRMESKEEVLEAAKDASWNRIMSIIQIMIDENFAEREKAAGVKPIITRTKEKISSTQN